MNPVAHDPELQEIAAYAAEILGVPRALVTRLGETRQTFLAAQGFERSDTSLEEAFCAYTVQGEGVFEVDDASADPRFADNPLVAGEDGIRFYAGVAVASPDGRREGALCVLDTQPRRLTPEQRRTLTFLAHQAETRLALLERVRRIEQERARVETAVEESRRGGEFLHVLTDRLPVRVGYVTPDFRYVFLNGEYERTFGFAPGEAWGRTVEEIVGPDAWRAAEPHIRRALAGETHTQEFSVRYPFGERRIQATYVADLNPDGDVRGVVVQALDVTARYGAEQALAREREETARSFDAAEVAAWVIDTTTGLVHSSARLRFLFNLPEDTPDWTPASRYLDAIREEDRARAYGDLARMGEVGETFHSEFRATGADGKERWLLSRGTTTQGDDGKPRASGAIIDVSEQRAAASALRESEAALRATLDASAGGFYSVDAEGNTVHGNAAFLAMLGIPSMDEVRGKKLHGVIHHSHPDGTPYDVAECPIYRAASGGTSAHVVGENFFRYDDGAPFPVEYWTEPILVDGQNRGAVTTFVDITERKAAEEARLRQAVRYQAVFEAIEEGFCIIEIVRDETGKARDFYYREINPAFERMTGIAAAALSGRTVREIIPGYEDHWIEAFGEVARTGEPFSATDRVEGLHRWYEVRAACLGGEGSKQVAIVFNDVSARKRDEAALETHARLANLAGDVGLALTRGDELRTTLQACAEALVRDLDASVARIWTLDDAGDTLELQASAGMDTDLEGSQSRLPVTAHAIGRIVRDARPKVVRLDPDDPSFGEPGWIARGGMVGFAGYPLLVNGRAMGVVGVYSPEPPLAPDALRALATVADALALGVNRKRAERDLERAKEVAEDASRTKSLFLANMSHELRTPLNAILGYSEMLQEEAADQNVPDFIPDLEKINGAGKHLLALINDILDISKIEAGKMELYVEEFDVDALLEEVESTMRPLVEKNANALRIVRRDPLGAMRSDLTKVRQCLFNLVSNAAKFTKDGEIGLEVARETMEGVTDAEPTDWLVFRVTDTGIGMSADGLLKLFQAFTQADASTTRKFGGTGLGLTITRRFCQMLGGDVTVSSELGKGSVFTIKIRADVEESVPAPGVDAPADAENAPPAEPPPPGTCVLVVDDDATQRDLMRRFLASEGFPAETASGGEEGLRLARLLRPLAITLDVMMPGMDGWSVLAALKADPELRDIPVVMLTMVDDRRRGVAMGAADYATKPVDRTRLTQILQRYACQEPPCTVLLVEDDAPTRHVMGAMLRKDGWAVREATNGREAMAHVAEKTPHLILLDLMMPEMDGFEFAATLRENDAWRDVPIVVLTAMDLSDEDRQRLNGRVQSVVQKSGLTQDEVLRQVRDLVVACTLKDARPVPPA